MNEMNATQFVEEQETVQSSPLPADAFERLPETEKNAEFIAVESSTYWKDVWKRLCKNKLTVFGLIVMAIVITFAIFGPIFSPYTYEQQDYSAMNQLPSAAHWFGTDKFGRDIFTRVTYGARISLSVGFSAAFINLIIGALYGGIAGYTGGYVDMIMMRVVDILYSVPSIMYVILIMMFFGSNMFSVLFGICVSSWVGMARTVRSQVLSLKQQEFTLAARVLGASKSRILLKHLLVNSMGPIIVSMTFMVPSAMFTEAYLSFLGIGISAPMASWGTMAQDARALIDSHPIQMFWPVAAICITIFALNFIGDGLSEALDPKKK